MRTPVPAKAMVMGTKTTFSSDMPKVAPPMEKMARTAGIIRFSLLRKATAARPMADLMAPVSVDDVKRGGHNHDEEGDGGGGGHARGECQQELHDADGVALHPGVGVGVDHGAAIHLDARVLAGGDKVLHRATIRTMQNIRTTG